VRKWTHSAVHQPWFINEWQASIDALDEAFAMGFTEVPLPVPTKGCHTAPSHAGQRKGCTFSDDIQLYLGLEDELYAFSTTIRHESLQQWPEKPWRLATTRLKPTMTANDTLSQQFGTTPNCHFLGEREAPRSVTKYKKISTKTKFHIGDKMHAHYLSGCVICERFMTGMALWNVSKKARSSMSVHGIFIQQGRRV